jgi:Undecaprenyl-phosphate galactose phosphotransferase WbaP
MSTARVLSKKPISAPVSLIENPHRPAISAMLVFIADFATLWLMLRLFVGNKAIVGSHAGDSLHLWPLLTLFLVLYCICGVYPGISVGPVDDIKRISIANFSAFLFISLMLVFSGAPLHSQLVCLGASMGASVALALIRSAVRRVGSQFSWWGYPVVLFGGGEVALSVLRKLKSQPRLGLRPLALVTDRISESQMEGVAICRMEHLSHLLSFGVKHAIVAAPELSQSEYAEVLERSGDAFPYMIIIPDTHIIWKSDSYTRDLMGMPGLQVRNNLLQPASRIAKRAIDLGLCLLLTPLLLPLTAIIGILIAIESGFPVLYSQKRLGYDGRGFHIWKFRTMVRNAAEALESTLASDPVLRKEWMETQKLRNDPRITRVGKILRKTSLDELPQLWNVIKGEMSFVGPRPIVHEEVAKYKEAYSWYSRTTPGITGLWQVSGRNHTTYAERVAYDTYYVRNWSVWMDVYLLAKTVTVIFTGDGAY